MMEIIPAIDIIAGKCVRLTQGNYSQCNIYPEDPLEMARKFEAAGLKRLHLVDLDGAKSLTVVNLEILEKICKGTGLEVDFGGGIKSDTDIKKVFDAGAAFACIGSMAQTNRDKVGEWLECYGADRLIVGADVWDGKICINGWKKLTNTTVFELVDSYGGKLKQLMCTDIAKDGMLGGTAIELYKDLRKRYPDINLIASGGIGSITDLQSLEEIGLSAAIVGKAIYERKIKIELLGNWKYRP